MMWCQLDDLELLELVKNQLNSNWSGIVTLNSDDLQSVQEALRRLEKSFSKVKSPYFHKDGEIAFHIEHSVQYMMFLYFLSNSLYKAGKTDKASLGYYQNKIMNSVELFYTVEMPNYFCAEHPIGTVLGKASYGDFFFFCQGCTVGGNLKDNMIKYPVIGEYVTMYSNSKVLGDCHIGNNVIIGADTYIKDTDIPDNSMVFGQYPNLLIKSNHEKNFENIRKHLWL